MSDLTPITRKEKIIAGEDLTPITREEWFLKNYGGGGGGGETQIMFIRGTKNNANTSATLNKTFSEIYDFVKDGNKTAVVVISGFPTNGDNYYLLDKRVDGNSKSLEFMFVGAQLGTSNYTSWLSLDITGVKLSIAESAENATITDLSKSVVINTPKTLSGTLAAGATTLTLSDAFITTTRMIDVYTDVYGVNPTDITVATGSITLTFEAQQSAVNVKVRVS